MDAIMKLKSAHSKNLEFTGVFENFIHEVEKTELFRDHFGIEFTKNPSSLEFSFLNRDFRFDYSFIVDSQTRYWGRLNVKYINKSAYWVCPISDTTEVVYKTYFFDKFGNTKRSLEEMSSPLSISIEGSIKDFVVEILHELLNSDYFTD